MMKRFRKYIIICRLFGCLFIDGIWDRSLKKARVRMIGIYTLCTVAWILLSLAVSIILIGKLFLVSNIAQSFTKSLLFIVNSVVTTRIILNFGCMVRGSSRLRDSADKWRTQARKFLSMLALLVSYGLIIRVPVASLIQGEEKWWRLGAMIANIFTAFVLLFYDCIVYIVLSCCLDVLADYMRALVATLSGKDSRMGPYLQTRHEIEKVRLSVSTIKSLKRSINEMWHPALAVWAACLILIVCITLYAIVAGDFVHPDVWLPMAYSVHASISFADIAILSQALSDEAQYLHDTIDPEAMCLTGAGFFRLNKALLVS
ncbi:hypothetical protein V5799_022662, partial [Amblyomma americanum]